MKSIALLASLMLAAAVAPAAEVRISDPNGIIEATPAAPPTEDTYGPQRTWITKSAWDARPLQSDVTFNLGNFAGGQGIYRTGGVLPFFKIPVHLPAGAVVGDLEIAFCDTGTGNLAAHWVRQPKNGAAVFQFSVVETVGTPGCAIATGVITPHTIDNNNNSYNIELFMSDANNTLAFLSARIGYRLQVAPAPAVATFPNDVPTTHPLFRFVEALAAAGVTGGCGAGLFCPDAPITRGQMAVFLATALGLHFPN